MIQLEQQYEMEANKLLKENPDMEPWVERNPILREFYLKVSRECFLDGDGSEVG